MGVKMEKVKDILNFTKEISGAVLNLVETIDSAMTPKEEQLYSVSRYDEKGNKITLSSLREPDGSWHYHKTIDKEDGRIMIQYYDKMPTQKELDKMKA